MDNETDKHYMSMALSLAEKGRGKTSPNPMVGAVVVRDDMIVGQGYHQKAGEDHAEVIALREAGEAARGATLYVTLEPCCHNGKTPPCTHAICKSGIRRVVAAMMDENPLVCGEGIACLQNENIEVTVGVLENLARKLNETYLKFIREGIPFVTLKLATTLDGRIADTAGTSRWITGSEARQQVHQLRAWSDAVMVGIGTVLADDPALTVHDVEGSDPLRVVVDSHLRIPLSAKVMKDNNVIIATTDNAEKARLAACEKRGIVVWKLDSVDGRVSLANLLKKLGEREITCILCEGGGTLAGSLLKERHVDKVIFAIAPKILGSGKHAVDDIGIETLDAAIGLKERKIEVFGDDVLMSGYPEYR